MIPNAVFWQLMDRDAGIQIFIEERCFIRIEEFLTITAEHIFFLAVLKDFLGVKVVFEMGILFYPRKTMRIGC